MDLTDERLKDILHGSATVAVLGASTHPEKPANYVPRYLASHGYTVLPVNPAAAGSELFGHEVKATLAEADRAVDLVDVFRRPADIPPHLPDILAMRPLPKVVWFQKGIRNDEAAAALEAAGIVVVQDRCTLEEHERLIRGHGGHEAEDGKA